MYAGGVFVRGDPAARRYQPARALPVPTTRRAAGQQRGRTAGAGAGCLRAGALQAALRHPRESALQPSTPPRAATGRRTAMAGLSKF